MSIYQMRSPVLENWSTITMLLQIGLDMSEVTANLLVNRGVTGIDEAIAFLSPSLDQLHDPFLLQDMDKAVNRIRQTVEAGEKIVIYGDYDADGVTSSALLSLYLRTLGANVDVYIPSRQDEGYGLHKEALKTILEQGTKLLITVDCGISALEEVQEYKSYIDIIITDHHTPGGKLPDAYAVINPKIPGQAYPYHELAGVGVAAKLVQALGGIEGIRPYLDLVAIGTVADIVPLTGENRVYAALGILQLNESPRPGVSALLQHLEMKDKAVDAGRISYTIGPCLNAPGRMTTFRAGFDLLTTESVHQALPIASELVEQNRQRREMESLILESAEKAIQEQIDLACDRVIVVAGEGWHPGVIGIVASRITEQYCRPSIVLSLNGDQAVGSGRSMKGFHLYEALSSCSDLLNRFGGHEMAAGLSIQRSKIDDFRKQISAYAQEIMDDESLVPHYIYDGQLKHEQISSNLVNEIERLAPFGCGNPAPRFLLPSVVVENSRLIGKKSNHIKLALSLGQRSWDAVGFGMADAGRDLQQGCRVSLLTSLKRNEWMGVSSTQFQIHSMKRVYSKPEDLEDLLSSFHFKCFDVFYQKFMYNDNDALSTTWIKSEQCLLSLDNTVEYLKSSLVGTAIFVSTYGEASTLLKRLMNENLLDRIPVQYHHPYAGDGMGRSSVILIPDYRCSPERYYHTVITPQVEDRWHTRFREVSSIGQDQKYYRFVSGNDMHKQDMQCNDFAISRKQLGVLYKWLRKIIPGRNIWPDERRLLQNLREGTGFPWSGFQLKLALEIFRELDFISVDSGNQYLKIQCSRNPASRQLDESRLMKFYRQWLTQYGINDNIQ